MSHASYKSSKITGAAFKTMVILIPIYVELSMPKKPIRWIVGTYIAPISKGFFLVLSLDHSFKYHIRF